MEGALPTHSVRATEWVSAPAEVFVELLLLAAVAATGRCFSDATEEIIVSEREKGKKKMNGREGKMSGQAALIISPSDSASSSSWTGEKSA